MRCDLHGMTGRTFACMGKASASSKTFVYLLYSIFTAQSSSVLAHIEQELHLINRIEKRFKNSNHKRDCLIADEEIGI